MEDGEQIRSLLAENGRRADDSIDILESALLLAAVAAPDIDLGPYRAHLQSLVDETDTAQELGKPQALQAVLHERHQYAGDVETYDDLRNADLIQVIDRRRGLPVAIGILYIGICRALGWQASGLAFPGHFLINIDEDGRRLIVDPFAGGETRDAEDLRSLLKTVAGVEAELKPHHYAPVSDREVLVRLQNNIKTRAIDRSDFPLAIRAVEHTLLIAPDNLPAIRELGLLQARAGNLRRAVETLEDFLARSPADTERTRTTVLLDRLRRMIN
ncbi:MAG: hypothetical protein CMM50_04250 [Rhodospirillaceae bacterium]|nr:hypothetical protein [Rhodospirillaceae bacterium]